MRRKLYFHRRFILNILPCSVWYCTFKTSLHSVEVLELVVWTKTLLSLLRGRGSDEGASVAALLSAGPTEEPCGWALGTLPGHSQSAGRYWPGGGTAFSPTHCTHVVHYTHILAALSHRFLDTCLDIDVCCHTHFTHTHTHTHTSHTTHASLVLVMS